MSKPKRSKPAARLFVTTDRTNAERLSRLAVKATKEADALVSANTLHARAFPALLACLESCKECRAGTCDGSQHVQREAKPPTIGDLVSIADSAGLDVVVEVKPKSVETAAAEQVGMFFAEAAEDKQAPEPKKKPRKRSYPEGFVLIDEMRAYAVKNGIAPDRVDGVFEHFSNHHRAKGSVYVDWTLAFYTWVRNDKQYGGKNQARNTQPSAIQGGKDDLPW